MVDGMADEFGFLLGWLELERTAGEGGGIRLRNTPNPKRGKIYQTVGGNIEAGEGGQSEVK